MALLYMRLSCNAVPVATEIRFFIRSWDNLFSKESDSFASSGIMERRLIETIFKV